MHEASVVSVEPPAGVSREVWAQHTEGLFPAMVGKTAEAAVFQTRDQPEPFRTEDFAAYLKGFKSEIEGRFVVDNMPVQFSFSQARREDDPEGDILHERIDVSMGTHGQSGFKAVSLTRNLTDTGAYSHSIEATRTGLGGEADTALNDNEAVRRANEMTVLIGVMKS